MLMQVLYPYTGFMMLCEYVAAVPGYVMLLLMFVLLDQNQLDWPGMSKPAHIGYQNLTGYFALIICIQYISREGD